MTEPVIHVTQEHRDTLIADPTGRVVRKRSRAIALQMHVPFTVETDRGLMRGEAGDWLMTNHPDDDPGSDLWSISDARFQQTYEPAIAPSVEGLLIEVNRMLGDVTKTRERHPLDAAQYHVEVALDEIEKYVVAQGVL